MEIAQEVIREDSESSAAIFVKQKSILSPLANCQTFADSKNIVRVIKKIYN